MGEELTEFVQKLIAAPFLIFAVLFVHEMGHYLAARSFKMKIPAVAIGCGKELWSRTDSYGSRWSVHLWPLWAHVSLAGWNEHTFDRKDLCRRLLTVLAGPCINLALPFVLIFGFFVAFGQPSIPPVISGIDIGGVADKAGFELGDRITKINGTSVHSWREMKRLGYKKDIREVRYTVERDGREIELLTTPKWHEYRDVDGIERKHARLEILLRHQPYKLEVLRVINGEPVRDDSDKARKLLLENLGKETIVGLYSTDTTVSNTRVILPEEANAHLTEPDHENYETFYISPLKDNVYLRQSLGTNLYEASVLSLKLIKNIALLPFQVFPIDPETVTAPARVIDEDSWLVNQTYRWFYMISVISVFTGLVNLLPLPSLDGSYIVRFIYEGFMKKPFSRKGQALIFVGFFGLFYAAIFLSNMDNIPHYIDSRLKKLQESMTKED